MTSAETKHREIGRCIYCGTSDGELTKEHIIPKGLGGELTLGHATCKACQRITSTTERLNLRGPFGNVRVGANVKRAESGPRKFDDYRILVKDATGQEQIVDLQQLPDEKLPVYFVFYEFPEGPGILTGIKDHADVLMQVHHFHADTIERHAALGDEPAVRFRARLSPYLAMLGKIALGLTVFHFGFDAFPTFVRDLALNRETDPLRFIGQYPGANEPPILLLHEHSIDLIDDLIVVNLRLFANCGLPTYKVVVGTVTNCPKWAKKVAPAT